MDAPSALASAAVSGAGAAVLTALGIDPAALFWAFVGASIGMTFAAAATRVRTAVVFCCVVLCCSLFGAFLAMQFTSGNPLGKDAFACGLALVFHPFLSALITLLPTALNGVLRRLGIGSP